MNWNEVDLSIIELSRGRLTARHDGRNLLLFGILLGFLLFVGLSIFAYLSTDVFRPAARPYMKAVAAILFAYASTKAAASLLAICRTDLLVIKRNRVRCVRYICRARTGYRARLTAADRVHLEVLSPRKFDVSIFRVKLEIRKLHRLDIYLYSSASLEESQARLDGVRIALGL
jgi:hypothetical protein